MAKIKVLIVDDSAVVRNLLTTILSSDRHIEVVGTAPDPFIARDKVVRLKPDVLTLDVEMPRMDGITFLGKLMAHFPIPVVIVSSLTQKGAETTIKAFEAGAVDVIAKPEMDVSKGIEVISADIIAKVRAAASAKVSKRRHPPVASKKAKRPVHRALVKSTNKVIAIGASTGGTEAIRAVLEALPADTPGTVIVQHMPEKFSKAFAERLNSICAMEVREAKEGDGVIPGTALIAPGSHHMVLKRSGARYYVSLNQDAPVHHQRPAVDVLFDSVANFAGPNSVGAVLTGMGADGAAGLLHMREAGARTLAQDEATSIVYGMPKEAAKLGAAEKILPLQDVARMIIKCVTSK